MAHAACSGRRTRSEMMKKRCDWTPSVTGSRQPAATQRAGGGRREAVAVARAGAGAGAAARAGGGSEGEGRAGGGGGDGGSSAEARLMAGG